MLEKQSNLKAWLYLAPATILLAIFTFYPLFNAFFLSILTEYEVVLGSPVPNAAQPTLDNIMTNFKAIFKDDDFWLAMKNTGVIVFVSVPLSVLIALFISVALNSVKKFQGFFQTVFFLPYVTNAVAIGMAFAFIFHTDYGLINLILSKLGMDPVNWIGTGASWNTAMFTLIVYTVWGGLAFKIMVFLSGLQSIDKQYYDAARVDATPRKRVFTKITVPLLSPMIAYITITSFIGAVKAYRTIIGLFGVRLGPPAGDRLITIVGLVYEQIDAGTAQYPQAAAIAVVLFVITLAFTGVQMWVSKKRVHF